MTCAEFLELTDAYALGALEGAEQRAAQAHLASLGSHDGCPGALRRAELTSLTLALALEPVTPHERVWQAIEARISPRAAVVRSPARSERLLWGAALAACLAVAALFGGQLLRERAARPGVDPTAQALLAVLQSPTGRLVPLVPQEKAEGHARALLDLAGRRGLVIAGALPARPGSDYQLWIIRGGQKLSAGLLRAGASGEAVAQLDPRLLEGGTPDALAVSIEPQGGSPQPTGPIILVGAIPKA